MLAFKFWKHTLAIVKQYGSLLKQRGSKYKALEQKWQK